MDGEPRRAARWPVALAIVVGIGLGGGTFVLTRPEQAPAVELRGSVEAPDQTADAIAFLKAWDRFRNSTFVVDLKFERQVTGIEQPLVGPGRIVQQPPVRATFGFGGQSLVTGEGEQSCADVEQGQACTGVSDSEPYDVQVARELSAFSQLLSGKTPVYRVVNSGSGCFAFTLYRAVGLPPYGDRASFCFDPASGAMTLFETVSSSGRDRVTATEVRTSVLPEDLEG